MTEPAKATPAPDGMGAYRALQHIIDMHYQAQSAHHPEGECAICFHLDPKELRIVGDPFPCATYKTAMAGLGLDGDSP